MTNQKPRPRFDTKIIPVELKNLTGKIKLMLDPGDPCVFFVSYFRFRTSMRNHRNNVN